MSKNKLWQRWLLALLFALGLGVVWGFLLAFGGSVVSALSPGDGKTHEGLQITVDGEPLVQAFIGGNYTHTELRTLDGQLVDQDQVQLLGSVSTYPPYRSPGLIEWPVIWRERLAGMCDYARPPVEWMMIRDAEPLGHVYLSGFDTITKLPVGYIGLHGFRQAKPPEDEQFHLGPHRLNWEGRARVTSIGRIEFGSRTYPDTGTEPNEKQVLAYWLVYLADADGQIHEINLRTHAVRSLAEISEVASIAIAGLPLPLAKGDGEDEAGQDDVPINGTLQFHTTGFTSSKIPEFRLTQHVIEFRVNPNPSANKKRKIVHRLLVRCVDRLVVINPFDDTQQVFPLPEGLEHANFSVSTVADDRLLLQVQSGHWEQGNVVDVMGLNSAGEVTPTQTVRLASSYVPGDPRVESLSAAAVAPSPVAWLAGITHYRWRSLR